MGVDLYAGDAPPHQLMSEMCVMLGWSVQPEIVLALEELGNFPSLRSFAFRYSFEDVTAVLPIFASIPAHLERLTIRSDTARVGPKTELGDVAQREIITAMGPTGQGQLKELQLDTTPALTIDVMRWLFGKCKALTQSMYTVRLFSTCRGAKHYTHST